MRPSIPLPTLGKAVIEDVQIHRCIVNRRRNGNSPVSYRTSLPLVSLLRREETFSWLMSSLWQPDRLCGWLVRPSIQVSIGIAGFNFLLLASQSIGLSLMFDRPCVFLRHDKTWSMAMYPIFQFQYCWVYFLICVAWVFARIKRLAEMTVPNSEELAGQVILRKRLTVL